MSDNFRRLSKSSLRRTALVVVSNSSLVSAKVIVTAFFEQLRCTIVQHVAGRQAVAQTQHKEVGHD